MRWIELKVMEALQVKHLILLELIIQKHYSRTRLCILGQIGHVGEVCTVQLPSHVGNGPSWELVPWLFEKHPLQTFDQFDQNSAQNIGRGVCVWFHREKKSRAFHGEAKGCSGLPKEDAASLSFQRAPVPGCHEPPLNL